MATADYLNFLCALGYNASAMKTFNGAPYRCPAKRMSIHDLNYPSITALALPGGGLPTVRRRVKNVGGPGTYTAAVVQEPEGVQVVVTPHDAGVQGRRRGNGVRGEFRGEEPRGGGGLQVWRHRLVRWGSSGEESSGSENAGIDERCRNAVEIRRTQRKIGSAGGVDHYEECDSSKIK
jgi:hypothetical protein